MSVTATLELLYLEEEESNKQKEREEINEINRGKIIAIEK